MRLTLHAWLLCALALCVSRLARGMDHEIPKKYVTDEGFTSLFCNTCAQVVVALQERLDSEEANFESLYGYRLDSKGNKIRKKSALLTFQVAVEGVCEKWKNKWRLAKRRNGNLYLVPLQNYTDIERSVYNEGQAKRDELDKEQEERWAEEDRIAAEKAARGEGEDREEEDKEDTEKEKEETVKSAVDSSGSETPGGGEEAEGEENKNATRGVTKVPYYLRKPKFLKMKSKYHKEIEPVCHVVAEHLEEWAVNSENALVKEETQDGEEETRVAIETFCASEYPKLCVEDMFDDTIEFYRLKKEHVLKVRPQEPIYEDLTGEDLEDNEDIIDKSPKHVDPERVRKGMEDGPIDEDYAEETEPDTEEESADHKEL